MIRFVDMSDALEMEDRGAFAWFDTVTDTFLSFMMGGTDSNPNFTKEMVIMGAVVALRKYAIEFDSETPVFTKFYKEYQKWIVSTA